MADCKENKEEDEPRPRVTTKLDSPDESSDNSANEESEKLVPEKDSDSSCSSNSMLNNETKPRGPIFTSSRFGNSFGANTLSSNNSDNNKPFRLKPSILRRSALGTVTNSSSSTKSVIKPATFHNPFTKVNLDESATVENNTQDKATEEESTKDDDKSKKDDDKDEKKEEKEQPKFIALSKSTNDNPGTGSNNSSVAAASASTPSFVFGQNIKERVAVAQDAEGGSEDGSEKEEPKEESSSNENGSSSELMFSNAAAAATKSSSKPGMTLSQAAQEMEEASRANKRKYDEVALLTGEEDETNIFQINCKLFAFDKVTSSYQERGRGSLRLNDKDEESRLVGRAAGTQRLVLNTKVWPGMTVERAGPKSIRLTAVDAQGEIRIFVVQANQKEVEQLHNLLLQRLKRAQDRQPKKLAAEH